MDNVRGLLAVDITSLLSSKTSALSSVDCLLPVVDTGSDCSRTAAASNTTRTSVPSSHHTIIMPQLGTQTKNTTPASEELGQVLTKARLQDLVKEFDPNEQLDEEVEDVLLEIADDFVESAVTAACLLAKHRKANTIEVKDVQLYLERDWNMWQPGFGMEELRPYKRTAVTEAHKQRLALIRKAVKKY